MINHSTLSSALIKILIKNKEICFAGNRRLKIYGSLNCKSGKRMKKENRVFFKLENDALKNGFRPCGNCLKEKYKKMDLFNTTTGKNHNLLPYGGNVSYFGKLFTQDVADMYFDVLWKTVEWKNDEAFIMGKHIVTKRKVAWYGDLPYSYTYSRASKTALPWTPELLELKKIAEEQANTSFNSCLLNLYHNGDEGMAYHSDDEKALARDSAIASMSFGAERKFLFKHKETKETISTFLEHGSLLVMAGETQTHWLHRLPPTKKVNRPRINLTFRTMDI